MVTLGNRLEGQGYHLWLVMHTWLALRARRGGLPLAGYLVHWVAPANATKTSSATREVIARAAYINNLDLSQE